MKATTQVNLRCLLQAVQIKSKVLQFCIRISGCNSGCIRFLLRYYYIGLSQYNFPTFLQITEARTTKKLYKFCHKHIIVSGIYTNALLFCRAIEHHFCVLKNIIVTVWYSYWRHMHKRFVCYSSCKFYCTRFKGYFSAPLLIIHCTCM